MENWKKAVVAGASGASMVMFLKRRPAAGVVFAGISLVTLATEYPEQFAKVRRVLPDYFGQGLRLADFAARAGQRIVEFAESRGRWLEDEFGSRFR
ncbi:MAG TPA: hypothetical protein VGF06_02560 [Terriglobales bacterium]